MIGLEKFPKTIAVIQQGIEKEWHFGAQVYISQDQEALADFAIGSKDQEKTKPMRTDSLIGWMSCSKMITAVAVGLLWEQRRLDFNWPVAQIIPEFACHGKEEITFTHLLTHTCGIRNIQVRWENHSWDELIAKICELPVEEDWTIGQSAGYHVATSWMILGEAIQRISGQKVADFIEEEIFSPLDMNNSFLDCSKEEWQEKQEQIAPFFDTWSRPRIQRDKFNDSLNNCKPGSSGRGPIRELGIFMEMLFAKGDFDGIEVLKDETIDVLTSPYRQGMVDQTFGQVIDWGLGIMLDSKKYGKPYPYNFGPFCSETTFGHNGNQSSAAYVDPENDLVICFAFNGMPGEINHQTRLDAINRAIYEDLGLN